MEYESEGEKKKKNRDKEGGRSECESAEEHESERDEELNASSYPQRSTALKPFHNFLFPFLSELVYIQNMCVCVFIGLHASVAYPFVWVPGSLCVCVCVCVVIE